MTTFHVRVADNGYIVEALDETRGLTVYEGEKVPKEMCIDILAEMIDRLELLDDDELMVSVSVRPVTEGGEE